ncbi:transposase [Ensifer mexicanus]|nr:transposase [Sinorhizobium mexicanum]
MKGLLFCQGIRDYEPLRRDRRARLEELRTGDRRALPRHIRAQISRELDRLELLLEQIKTVEAERDLLTVEQMTSTPAPAAVLLRIRGIGPEFAAILHSEGLFRHFDNRRQVAAYAGLAPSPWQSGSIDREQGVSKAGNPRLRTTMVELAWLWLRYQPGSTPSCWFKERVTRNGGRFKKTMDRGTRPQAAGRAMEISERRCRHRGGSHEIRLTGDRSTAKAIPILRA